MAVRKNPLKNVEVVHRPRPRKRTGMPLLDPEQIRREVSPLANLLPSQSARDGEVIAPYKRRPEFAELRTRANFADVIKQAWTEAEENFAAIGRYLNHAKMQLNHGEFMAMVENDLPFRYSTANRLMKVAAALDAGVLPTNRLPPSYATVYELLTLSEEERQRALDEGVVRPEMQRKDVAAFRKQLRQLSVDKRAKLEAERERLKKRLEEIEQELIGLAAGHEGE
jgi:Protein of unknown function (DUF3102)